jgi:hypothetical protein
MVARVTPTIAGTGIAPSGTIAGQWSGEGNFSWLFFTAADLLSTGHSNNGSSAAILVDSAGTITAADTWLAQSVDISGQLRSYRSTNGTTWTQFGSATPAAYTIFDSAVPVTIGNRQTTFPWAGRIYSVEMRTGLDPVAGSVLWRFDASEYPGNGATSYVDPRGRTWTLQSASSIVHTPPDSIERVNGAQVYLPTVDQLFRFDNDRWRLEQAPLRSYTPIYNSLTLGTGGTNIGGYTISDNICTAQGEVTFGTGGAVTAPSLYVTLPPELLVNYHADPGFDMIGNIYGWRQLGIARYFDESTLMISRGSMDTTKVDDPYTGSVWALFYSGHGGGWSVSNTNPFTWTSGDQLWWKIQFDIL